MRPGTKSDVVRGTSTSSPASRGASEVGAKRVVLMPATRAGGQRRRSGGGGGKLLPARTGAFASQPGSWEGSRAWKRPVSVAAMQRRGRDNSGAPGVAVAPPSGAGGPLLGRLAPDERARRPRPR